MYQTPFALKLDDFVMETYPGSDSPSAYESSHVQIVDEGKQTPYKNLYEPRFKSQRILDSSKRVLTQTDKEPYCR